MIKVSRYNIPVLERFLKKEHFTIEKDVPIVLKNGNLIGWDDVVVTITRGKKEIKVYSGEFIERIQDKLKIHPAPKYTIDDYIRRGFRTYLQKDIPYSSVQELREDFGRDVIIDEVRKIVCIR